MRQAREAALDAQLLVVATDLGKEKASQLFSEGTAFDPTAFAEHLVSTFIAYTYYLIIIRMCLTSYSERCTENTFSTR